MKYVCGFYFDYSMEQVLLIRKNRPDWMKDKWQGIGGKIDTRPIEPSTLVTVDRLLQEETPYQAMVREFKEECGIQTYEKEWQCYYIKQYSNDAKMYFFAAFGDAYKDAISITDEEVKVHEMVDLAWDLPDYMFDLAYLIAIVKAEVKSGFFRKLNPEGINNGR